jgi:Uma2 family endonuclease
MTTPVASAPPAVVPTRRRFTVVEYYAMADAGILSENDRVELLDGDVIVMPPIGDWHASGVAQIIALFPSTILDGRAILQIQNPVRLDSDNEPQPDAMLLRWRNDFYRNGHPGPDDVLLLIEVSDTTVDYDRNNKLPRYARAGIPEVWIDNRRDRRIEAYTDPSGDEYATVRYAAPGETIAPQAFPDITLQVDRIIGD